MGPPCCGPMAGDTGGGDGVLRSCVQEKLWTTKTHDFKADVFFNCVQCSVFKQVLTQVCTSSLVFPLDAGDIQTQAT